MKLNTAVWLFMTRWKDDERREGNLFTFSFIPSFLFSPSFDRYSEEELLD